MPHKPRRACGKHLTLADNEGARVAQCPCGAVHVHVKSSGLSIQLDEERFHQLGLAVMGAVSALGSTAMGVEPTGTPDQTVN